MEKKEHHSTRAKRLREEAAALEGTVASIPDAPVASPVVQAYNIYSARAELVGYAKTEKEANEELAKWVGGFKKLI